MSGTGPSSRLAPPAHAGRVLRGRGTSRHAFRIDRLLKTTNFIENPDKATAEGGERVGHLDRRLLTENAAPDDTVAHHFSKPLVHYLGRQARAISQHGAGPAGTVRQKPKQADGPLASHNTLDHCRDRDGRSFLYHCVPTLPESAIFQGARQRLIIGAWKAEYLREPTHRPKELRYEKESRFLSRRLPRVCER